MAILDQITCNPTGCGCIPLRSGTLLLLSLSVLIDVFIGTKILLTMMGVSLHQNGSFNSFEALLILLLLWSLLSCISSVIMGSCSILCNKEPSFLKPYVCVGVVDLALYTLMVAAAIFISLSGNNTLYYYEKPELVLGICIQLPILSGEKKFIHMVTQRFAPNPPHIEELHVVGQSVVYRYYERLKAEANPLGDSYHQDAIP